MIFGLDGSTISAIAAGASTGLAGWFYRLLQKEVKARPDLKRSSELLKDEVKVLLNGLPEELRKMRLRTERLDARLEELEGTVIRVEISHGTLESRIETLESRS